MSPLRPTRLASFLSSFRRLRRAPAAPKPTPRTRSTRRHASPIQPLESRTLFSYNFVDVHSFSGSGAGRDGFQPYTLILDSQGNIYGSASNGGGPATIGTIYKLPAGASDITTIVSFPDQNNFYSHGTMVTDAQGNLYSIAVNGGPLGLGSIYELPAGSTTPVTLAVFNNALVTGESPYGGLTRDIKGNLYGTTVIGGTYNDGVVWELPVGSSNIITLATFNQNDQSPSTSLVFDAQGNLFGNTLTGGVNDAGEVFEVAAGTHAFSVVASFDNDSTGEFPLSNMIFDKFGNLYGTTSRGAGHGYGAIFVIPRGTNTINTLFSFDLDNGYNPLGDLFFDSADNLYGVTTYGGDDNHGTVFEYVAAANTVVILHYFDGDDGNHPTGSLLMDRSGDIFGTTTTGGLYDKGALFELQASFVPSGPPLPLIISTLPPQTQTAGPDFLTSLYQDLLGRTGDSSGLAYWNAQLASGATPAQVADSFLQSTEHYQYQVETLYQSLLNRTADAAGLTSWTNFLAAGGSLAQLQSQLLGSSEYFTDHASTASSDISAMYLATTGRAADASGLNYWTSKYTQGASLTSIALSLIQSPEASQRIVQLDYNTYLQRNPDASGLTYWTTQLAAGLSQSDLIASLVTSSEYITQ